MDFQARLKKKHILDLIAYLRQAHKKNVNLGDESESEDERLDILAKSDYFEHSLFLGLMPDEDSGPYDNHLVLTETEKQFEAQEALIRNYDHHPSKVEDSFSFKRVWSEPLITTALQSIRRFSRYVNSDDLIRNEEISKYNS